MQNSEDIATVVDREPISIDSVSVHQNYERAVMYLHKKACKEIKILKPCVVNKAAVRPTRQVQISLKHLFTPPLKVRWLMKSGDPSKNVSRRSKYFIP